MMIGFAAVNVFVILFWLVSYMVDFMMKKRSREFKRRIQTQMIPGARLLADAGRAV